VRDWFGVLQRGAAVVDAVESGVAPNSMMGSMIGSMMGSVMGHNSSMRSASPARIGSSSKAVRFEFEFEFHHLHFLPAIQFFPSHRICSQFATRVFALLFAFQLVIESAFVKK
jgi:hypothetical protein